MVRVPEVLRQIGAGLASKAPFFFPRGAAPPGWQQQCVRWGNGGDGQRRPDHGLGTGPGVGLGTGIDPPRRQNEGQDCILSQ